MKDLPEFPVNSGIFRLIASNCLPLAASPFAPLPARRPVRSFCFPTVPSFGMVHGLHVTAKTIHLSPYRPRPFHQKAPPGLGYHPTLRRCDRTFCTETHASPKGTPGISAYASSAACLQRSAVHPPQRLRVRHAPACSGTFFQHRTSFSSHENGHSK